MVSMDNKTAMDKLANCIADRCFHGVLPPGAAPEVVAAVVACFPQVHDAPEALKRQFIQSFLPAVEARLARQEQRDLA